MGSDNQREVPGQADTPVTYEILDEENGQMIVITLVCTCDNPVKMLAGKYFYCLHCDRDCSRNPKSCINCMDYSGNFEDRDRMLQEEDDEE